MQEAGCGTRVKGAGCGARVKGAEWGSGPGIGLNDDRIELMNDGLEGVNAISER